jgi:hypothetical protein
LSAQIISSRREDRQFLLFSTLAQGQIRLHSSTRQDSLLEDPATDEKADDVDTPHRKLNPEIRGGKDC